MRFEATVYDSNGKILYVQEGATALAMQGKQYVQGAPTGDMDDFYVSDGVITAKGSQPSDAYFFNYSTEAWEFDLASAKHGAWSMIKIARDIEEFGTFVWSGHTFDCDEVSQRRIQGAVQLASLDSTISMDWTLSDNSVQTFNATQLQDIGQALAAHVNACHVKGREKRAAIDAATTEAELDAISW